MASTTSLLLTKSLTIDDLEDLYRAIAQALNCPSEPLRDSFILLEKHFYRYLVEDSRCSRRNLSVLLKIFEENKKFDSEKIKLILRDINGNSENLKSIYELNDKQDFIDLLNNIKFEEQKKISLPNLIPVKMRTGIAVDKYTHLNSSQTISIAETNNNEGEKYLEKKDWIKARRCFIEAKQFAEEAKDEATASLALQNLNYTLHQEGSEYFSQKKWVDARTCFKEAMQFSLEAKDQITASTALKNLSITALHHGAECTAQKKFTEAHSIFKEGLQYAQETKDEVLASDARKNIAATIHEEATELLHQKKWAEARKFFKEAAHLAQEEKFTENAFRARRNLAILAYYEGQEYLTQKNSIKAHKCFKESMQLALEVKDKEIVSTVLECLTATKNHKSTAHPVQKNQMNSCDSPKDAAPETKDDATTPIVPNTTISKPVTPKKINIAGFFNGCLCLFGRKSRNKTPAYVKLEPLPKAASAIETDISLHHINSSL